MRERRSAWLSGLLLALPGLGCLDAPPAAQAGTDEVDGGVAGEADASPSCQVIVRDRFDDPGEWVAVAPPATFVDALPTWVRVRATPSEEMFVYGDLHTLREAAIEATALTVEVEGPIVSVAGQVGISWNSGGGDDYYHLVVSSGNLRALHKASAGGEMEVCPSSPCSPYSQFEHARLRLREEDGNVLYESAPAQGLWQEVGRAPASGLDYQAVLFAEATGPGSGDLTVTGAEWSDCGE